MSILQWNIRGFNTHRNDLRYLISQFNPYVICLQETFLNTPPFPIPNYTFIHLPHSIHASSILIHSSVPHQLLANPTTLPCTFLRIFLKRWITLFSIYLSPSLAFDFTSLQTFLASLPPPFLVLGDFNSRNPFWGD